MGRDKALVTVDGEPMAERVRRALVAAGIGPVAAIGGDLAALAPMGFVPVPDPHQGEGPVAGLLAAVTWAAQLPARPERVAVVACDLPWLTPAVIGDLLAAGADPDADVVLALGGRREPLVGVWSVATAAVLADAFERGDRAVWQVLERLVVAEVAVDPHTLGNVNRPEDLTPGVGDSPDELGDR